MPHATTNPKENKMDSSEGIFKILIVDDISNNIQLVANILKPEGYQLVFARNGKSALEKISKFSFDLILLDIMMPDMDGFEICRTIKASDSARDIPIIFLTAKSDSTSIVKGLEMGAVDYINKPFNHAELKARVKTHLQLKRTQERLASANATKDKFFSIIAHDLRNPFNHIIGFSEILLDRYERLSEDKKRSYIQNIHDSSLSMHRLLENLLSWSRIQLGQITKTPMTLPVRQLVESSIALLQNHANSKSIQLISDISDEVTVFADYNMVETAIRNLLSNAIKFTPKNGQIRIVSIERDLFVSISIIDNGVGISEDDLGKLFQIDEQFTQTGTDDEPGSGLGLILCKEFIEQNGGNISVESTPGKGSKFTFSLPCAPEFNQVKRIEETINY